MASAHLSDSEAQRELSKSRARGQGARPQARMEEWWQDGRQQVQRQKGEGWGSQRSCEMVPLPHHVPTVRGKGSLSQQRLEDLRLPKRRSQQGKF